MQFGREAEAKCAEQLQATRDARRTRFLKLVLKALETV